MLKQLNKQFNYGEKTILKMNFRLWNNNAKILTVYIIMSYKTKEKMLKRLLKYLKNCEIALIFGIWSN